MNDIDVKKLWGEDLYNVFAEHIDDEGWLPAEWSPIIENEVPRLDKYYNDNPEYARAYSAMYHMDFEDSQDGTKIRPVPGQFY